MTLAVALTLLGHPHAGESSAIQPNFFLPGTSQILIEDPALSRCHLCVFQRYPQSLWISLWKRVEKLG